MGQRTLQKPYGGAHCRKRPRQKVAGPADENRRHLLMRRATKASNRMRAEEELHVDAKKWHATPKEMRSLRLSIASGWREQPRIAFETISFARHF